MACIFSGNVIYYTQQTLFRVFSNLDLKDTGNSTYYLLAVGM